MDIQGEKIKCLSNFQAPELVVGRVYTAGITRKNVHGVWQVEVDGKWYIHDRFELVGKEQPQGIPPSHVALGNDLVQVGGSHMKIWCDTCQGAGEIDETLGGESFSSRNTHCPDCDGKGWWERVIAASVDNVRAQQEWTDKHYDNNYTLTQKDIERGFVKIDPYFVSKMWKIGRKDDSGALWHCFKTIARFGEKNSREREVKALYAQIKRLAEIEGVEL